MKRKQPFIILLVIASLVALFFISRRYLVSLGIRLSGEILKELVERETNELYHLSYEDINISLREKNIWLKGAVLAPDSIWYDQLDSLDKNNIYQVHISELEMNLESIFSIYLQKTLSIKGVRIVDPQIRMVRTRARQDRANFSLEAGNLYKLISDYLRVLKIDYFKLEKGSLDHFPSQFSMDSIDFAVDKLRIDSSQKSNRVFYSESIQLVINNQQLLLPDSIHIVSFDQFRLSTIDSVLTFKNVIIKPDQQALIAHEGNNNFNLYQIRIPTLDLEGVDYVDAYQNNQLSIAKVSVIDPIIYVDDEIGGSRVDRDNDNSLLKLLTDVFDQLRIGHFELKNANLEMQLFSKSGNKQLFTTQKTDVNIYGIKLDSSNYQMRERTSYFEEMTMNIRDYFYLLPDSLHQLAFDHLKVNTIDSTLLLENFAIAPIRSDVSGKRNIFTVSVPELKLTNVNYIDALVNKDLYTQSLFLQRPDIRIQLKETSQEDTTINAEDDILKLIAPYFSNIRSDTIQMNKGTFQLDGQLQMRNFDLSMGNFHLDTGFVRPSQFYKTVDLSLTGLQYFPGNFSIQSLEVHNDLQDLEMHELEYLHQSDINRVEKASIYGFQLDSLVKNNFPHLDSIVMTNGSINYNFPDSAEKQALDFPKSQLKLVLENFSVNLGLEGQDTLYLDSLYLTMSHEDTFELHQTSWKNLNIDLKKWKHRITAQDFNYSNTDGNACLENVQLIPHHDSLNINEATIAMKQLKVSRFDQDYFWKEGGIHVGGVDIHEPDLEIMHRELTDIDTAAYQPKDIRIGQVAVHNGTLSYLSLHDTLVDHIVVEKFDVSARQFDLNRKNWIGPDFISFSDAFSFDFHRIHPQLAGMDSIYIGRFQHKSDEQRWAIREVYLQDSAKGFKIESETLDLDSLDAWKLWSDKFLALKKLQLENTQLVFTIDTTKDSKIPDQISLPFQGMSISAIELKSNSIRLNNGLGEERVAIQNDIQLERLALNSDTLIFNDLPSRIKSLRVYSRQPLSFPVGKDYTLHVNTYRISFPENDVTLSGIHLKPVYNRFDYSTQLEYQRDWFNVKVDSVQLMAFDLQSYLDHGFYRAERAAIHGGDAKIFRDKRLPLNTEVEIPLPQQMLLAVKPLVALDTLTIDAEVEVALLAETASEPGVVTFSQLEGSLYRIATVDTMYQKPMVLDARGILMDAGKFQASVSFDMHKPDHPFQFTGSIDTMDLTTLNTALKPIAAVNIKKGRGRSLSFNFTGNDKIATGEMDFYYRGLSVQVLNPETHDKKGWGSNINTFFANTFVIRKNNPGFLILRDGTIFAERDASRAIFHFWSKALLSGAISSIGINRSKKAERKYEKGLATESQ